MTHSIFVISLCLVLLACAERQDQSKEQTILIDDSIQSRQQLDKLDSSEIFSYSKWLPGEAPQWYEKWNKTTLIVVKTKKTEGRLQKERYALLNRILDSVDKGADILIVQDGILLSAGIQKSLRKFSPDELSAVDTMGRQVSKELYGSHAKSKTLIINTYANNKYSP